VVVVRELMRMSKREKEHSREGARAPAGGLPATVAAEGRRRLGRCPPAALLVAFGSDP
jgi:hypothetical protein